MTSFTFSERRRKGSSIVSIKLSRIGLHDNDIFWMTKAAGEPVKSQIFRINCLSTNEGMRRSY
jgi:hypothetical protein